MKRVKKVLALWFMMGVCYAIMEGVWRGGWVHISMFAVGGLCGIAVGAVNQVPRFYRLRILWQSVIGAAFVLLVELASGLILNRWLGLAIWDYSHIPGNLFGQICPQYAALWFVLMPFAIWLEDWLRWRLWREGQAYSLFSIYKDLVTFK